MQRTLDDIVEEQKKFHGEVIYKLINDVAEMTENMTSYELDELEITCPKTNNKLCT